MVVRPSLRDEVAEPRVPSGPRALRTALRTALEDGPARAAPPGRFPLAGFPSTARAPGGGSSNCEHRRGRSRPQASG
jgi:hypothetical protein